ncbi:GAF and ANTAR domain-containing protein [Actinomadura hibisca]|uniref:GAF and ANTAR domain-containing protein n=1 Tax=Actinomadura hibisca TaxID=68565 RepID=UPI00082D2025|nr:GAF and ANTAR domain-containing protein [Actinomadura hibisca]
MDRQEQAWRLVTAHASANDRPVSVQQVCQAAVPVLGADGYGVTLVVGPQIRERACASDPVVMLIEENQLASGEGPRTQADTDLAPVVVPDLAAVRDRWAGFVPPVLAAGVRAMFAFPLQVAGVRIGALDFYYHRPGPFSAGQLADAGAFAAIAARVAFRTHPAPAALAALPADRPPHGYPAVVHQAAGILVAHLDVEAADALVRLRAYAYLHDQSLTGLARAVLDQRVTTTDDEFTDHRTELDRDHDA